MVRVFLPTSTCSHQVEAFSTLFSFGFAHFHLLSFCAKKFFGTGVVLCASVCCLVGDVHPVTPCVSGKPSRPGRRPTTERRQALALLFDPVRLMTCRRRCSLTPCVSGKPSRPGRRPTKERRQALGLLFDPVRLIGSDALRFDPIRFG